MPAPWPTAWTSRGPTCSKYSARYFDIYMLNPMASQVEAFRFSLLGRGLFLPDYFAYGAMFSIVVFVVGFAVFRASEAKFADVI